MITQKEILKRFIENNPELVEGLSETDVKNICHSPWEVLKSTIKSGSCETVRLKFIGSFRASISYALNRKKFLEKELVKNPQDEEKKEDLRKIKEFLNDVEQNKKP